MADEKELEQLFEERLRRMDRALDEFDQQTEQNAQKLYRAVLEQYVVKFAYEKGFLKMNAKNLAMIERLDKLLDVFTKQMKDSALKTIAEAMLENTVMLKEYYGKMGFKKGALDPILKSMNSIYETIGIDSGGNILKGSYLDRLATGAGFRDQLKNYVTDALTGKMELSQFQQGFKRLITSKGKVDSSLLRYYKQYTHDAFMANIRAQDLQMADSLGLTWFMYAGTEIKTTRQFCREHVGKAYHKSVFKKWDNETFDGQRKPSEIYMGGYNCRHRPRYITEETAKDLDPSAEKDRA